ncbi:MAG: magnesium transporter [Alphaproteobacteria bacterium]|nr:magnesium transporter [Alphaproteobacteria bacterium]
MESDRKPNALEELPADDVYGLKPELVRIIREALEQGRIDDVRALALPMHYSDAADLLEHLEAEERRQLVEVLRPDLEPEVLTALDPAVRDEVIAQLGFADLAAAVNELESDDAVWLVDQLEGDEQRRLIEALEPEKRAIVEQGLAYPEYTAGRLMKRELVAVPSYWTVGETIDHLRDTIHLPEDFYDIFVVDPRHRPIGRVTPARLLRSKRPVRLRDIIDGEVRPVPVTMDQEEVAYRVRQRDLVSVPVVDAAGRLLGVITVDDVVDVIDEEAADDMLRLAGVAEPGLYHAIIDTTRSRFTWLAINLATAFLASMVIGMFSETIERVVALAVLMPIVASMGGNAGTQTLTVAVRALAMKELTPTNALRVIGKEGVVGLANGCAFAVLTGLAAWAWFGSVAIGAVIGAAMVINMLCAGLAGTLIPLGLERMGVDPAVSSSVFLTTVTDVVGFLAFLGLAAAFLL